MSGAWQLSRHYGRQTQTRAAVQQAEAASAVAAPGWEVSAEPDSPTFSTAAAGAEAAAAAGQPQTEWQIDADADLVLSDVHIGRAPSAAQRCTTVFRFQQGWIGRESSSSGKKSRSGGGGSNGDALSQPAMAKPVSSALPPAEVDKDGDVIVKRRRTAAAAAASGSSGAADGIVVHHAMATSLNEVGRQVMPSASAQHANKLPYLYLVYLLTHACRGRRRLQLPTRNSASLLSCQPSLQVWRGALLLVDLLLSRPKLVAGRTIAELGAGCGLPAIAAARAGAARVLLTDLPALVPVLQVSSIENSIASQTLFGSISTVWRGASLSSWEPAAAELASLRGVRALPGCC